MMPSIELRSVTKRYGNILALDSMNLKVDEPACIGLLGPNGAGKTTVMKILTNIVHPTSGEAMINGISVVENPQSALRDVGALVEQPEFYPYLTAREALEFVARVKGMNAGSVPDEIRRLSELTGITEYLNRKSGTFSRGMKQRLGIAAALVGNPEILVLDEPTFGLDPKGMLEVRSLITNLKAAQVRIILLSTHLTYEANELCDRIVIINKGKTVYDTGERVKANFIRMELESPVEGFSLPDELVNGYMIDGSTVIVEKREDVSNSELIQYVSGKGIRLKYILPYNDIDDIYVRAVQ
ncbi:MAG: ABC transporter ATP-binding protein [Thermoplasmata archaeon YP2-bin.285]|uniref:ABC transporter ATP-binding protein n=1 Tax=Candidatus Sysuiplasma superficiale TaxID=2823368 RepID=A0A8J7YR44_9ARCH|nr:ABC transporter ATP-binding protein [Candidatus Sysuiplasma superficiale]